MVPRGLSWLGIGAIKEPMIGSFMSPVPNHEGRVEGLLRVELPADLKSDTCVFPRKISPWPSFSFHSWESEDSPDERLRFSLNSVPSP